MEGLTVYVDLLFFVGFLIDGALIWVCSRLSGRKLKRAGWIVSAVLAALFGVLFCIWGHSAWIRIIGGILSAVLTCVLSFGFCGWKALGRDLLVYSAVNGCYVSLLFLAAALPGTSRLFLTSEGSLFCRVTLPALLLFTVLICTGLVCVGRFFRKRPARARICSCRVTLFDRQAEVLCYVDSGNFLRDTLSGFPVAVVEFSSLRELFPEHFRDTDLMTSQFGVFLQNRFRLIPYRGLSSGGVLAAFKPDSFQVNGIVKDAVVALSPERLEPHGRYHGIIGSAFIDVSPSSSRFTGKERSSIWKKVS